MAKDRAHLRSANEYDTRAQPADHAMANRAAGDMKEAIVKELKKAGKFNLPSFGTSTVRKTKARKGLNPRTGESIEAKAGKTVRFKASPTRKTEIQADNRENPLGSVLQARFAAAVTTAVAGAHAAGLAVPGRENGVAVEQLPNGTIREIDDPGNWSPTRWRDRSGQ